MAFSILGSPKPQFFDSSGAPLVNGTVSVLDPADDTNKASYPTYDDAEAATNANANPLTLDSRGEPSSGLWGLDAEDYKIVVKDSDGVTIWTVDDINLPAVTQAGVGAILYPTTSAETTAGVTPTNFQYEPGDVRRYGAIGDGTTDDTTAVQNAINACPAYGVVSIPESHAITGSGLTITNKSNIEIRGPGKLLLSSADVDANILLLVGTCDRVKVSGVEFQGDGLTSSSAFQYGVYNNSGQTLSNITVENCTFSDLNTNVAFNAESSGTFTNGFCINNYMANALGTLGGQGYGCFSSNATNVHFEGNIIENTQRHAFYISRAGTDPASDAAVSIQNNIIRGHRSAVTDNNYRPAIFCVSGFGVKIQNNYIVNYYDGGIGVGQDDTTNNLDAGNYLIDGNVFAGCQTVNAGILIGERSNPVSEYLTNVRVSNNRFYTDIDDSGNGLAILLGNGIGVEIVDNQFNIKNITDTRHRLIQVGQYTNAGATDLDSVLIARNTVVGTAASGATAPDLSFVYAYTSVSQGSSRVVIKDNKIDEDMLADLVEVQSTQTNSELVFGDYLAAATQTLSENQSGQTVYLDDAGGFTLTLPSPRLGLSFRFIVATAPTTAYIVTTTSGANELYGTVLDIVGELVYASGRDTVTFVASTSLRGDILEVWSDGTLWFYRAFSGADGGITTSVS